MRKAGAPCDPPLGWALVHASVSGEKAAACGLRAEADMKTNVAMRRCHDRPVGRARELNH